MTHTHYPTEIHRKTPDGITTDPSDSSDAVIVTLMTPQKYENHENNEPPDGDAADRIEIAKLLAGRLIQRKDVKALQKRTGAYKPVEVPWRVEDLTNHLDGKVTFGHYLLDSTGKTKVCAFDLDFDKEVTIDGKQLKPREVFSNTWHPMKKRMNAEIRSLADGLAMRMQRDYSVTVLVSFSGSKGIHVTGCFKKPVPASVARRVAVSTIESYGCFENERGKNFWVHSRGEFDGIKIETFPKQDSIGSGGYGNLMRVPLGVNQKTGAQGFFYDITRPIEELVPDDTLTALSQGSIR